MKFSVITPVLQWNEMVEQMIENTVEAGKGKDIEIVLIPDAPIEVPERFREKVKVVAVGRKTPAEKRNVGVRESSGEIIAFIDDDAYPEKNWFDVAEKCFDEDEKIGAVGGPNLTPPDATEMEKISGFVYGSPLGGGGTRFRYVKGRKRMLIDDFPTCNLFVRRSAFEDVGGFNLDYWPGEDTFFCNELVKSDWKILYEPELIIYHHRREAVVPHLKQVWRYATTRGFFARKFGGNSIKPTYFLPSLAVLGGIGILILTALGSIPLLTTALLTTAYLTAVLVNSAVSGAKSIKQLLLTSYTTILTHLTYGIGFLKGFLFPKKRAYFGR